MHEQTGGWISILFMLICIDPPYRVLRQSEGMDALPSVNISSYILPEKTLILYIIIFDFINFYYVDP